MGLQWIRRYLYHFEKQRYKLLPYYTLFNIFKLMRQSIKYFWYKVLFFVHLLLKVCKPLCSIARNAKKKGGVMLDNTFLVKIIYICFPTLLLSLFLSLTHTYTRTDVGQVGFDMLELHIHYLLGLNRERSFR